MKVKTELLQAFMQKYELSAAILAREMGVGRKTAWRYGGKRGNGAAVYLLLRRGRGGQNDRLGGNRQAKSVYGQGVNYGAGTFPKGRVYRTAERGRFFNAECTPLCKGQRTEQERYDGHARKSFAPNI